MMRKAEVNQYIDAVNSILLQRHDGDGGKWTTNFTANIFLATEDPAPVESFRAAIPKEWNLLSITPSRKHKLIEWMDTMDIPK